MAPTTIAVDDDKSVELELLSSGNFSDVEVICGNRSWKCHGAILVPRCQWFRKALTGHFKEANTRQITLAEADPICVDLVLKYIYGRGLDITSSVSKEHFVEHCVSLWHTADFLMLQALKPSVESAVRHYCDKRLKELCISPHRPTWRHPQHPNQLSPWALDLVKGLREAYEWQISHLKSVLMEFIWVAKTLTLQSGISSVLFDHLKETTTFADDFLGRYVCNSWLRESVWIPPRDKVAPKPGYGYSSCLRCCMPIYWNDFWNTQGQIINAFRRDSDNGYRGGWCRDCGARDNIPWRMERPPSAPSSRPAAQQQAAGPRLNVQQQAPGTRPTVQQQAPGPRPTTRPQGPGQRP